MKPNQLAGLTLGAMLAAGPAMASVLYDNPADIAVDAGNCLFTTGCAAVYQHGADIFGAQLFALGGAATVRGASFTELDAGGPFAGPRSVNWAIYSDVGGLPGASLAKGNARFSRKTEVGTDPDGLEIDAYGFRMGDVELAAGIYFLALQEVSALADNYLMVGTTGSGAAETDNGGITWQPGYADGQFGDLAVSLYGAKGFPVSEPASLAIFAAGLTAMGVVRRRRRA